MGKKGLKRFQEAVDYLQSQYSDRPEVAIVLGSGLGNFIAEVAVEKEIAYEDIPHFPVSTVEGHSGRLIFGMLSGKKVVLMAGRFHFYEGYSAQEIAFPVRLMQLLGATTLLLSNAAGSVNPAYEVGDIMIINDHISFFTPNPLIGKNIETFGPRFPDMSEPYDRSLIQKAHAIAAAHNYTIHEGVYVAVTGPTFETKAEYRLIKVAGGDVVGMSTVQEATVAIHMGMKVFAASVVTDVGLREDETKVTHEEVLAAAREAEPRLATIFRELVAAI